MRLAPSRLAASIVFLALTINKTRHKAEHTSIFFGWKLVDINETALLIRDSILKVDGLYKNNSMRIKHPIYYDFIISELEKNQNKI